MTKEQMKISSTKLSGSYIVTLITCLIFACGGDKPVPDENIAENTDESGVEVVIPEETYKMETFIGVDYSFNNEALNWPSYIRQNPVSNEIVVSDTKNTCLYVFTQAGEFIRKIGRPGQGPGDLLDPLNINIDGNGNIYVFEGRNRRISMFSKDGLFTKTFPFKDHSGYYLPFNVTHDGNILVPLPYGNYYLSEFNQEGERINRIGRIPESYRKLTNSKKRMLLLGKPFCVGQKYYLFLSRILTAQIYDSEGKIIKEVKIDEILGDRSVREHYLSPEEQANTHSTRICMLVQDIVFKNDKFYMFCAKTPKYSEYVAVLDKELNCVKKYFLPEFEYKNIIYWGIEILDKDESVLFPDLGNSEIIRLFTNN